MSDPVGEAVRRQRRRERLSQEAACLFCEFNDLRALVELSRTTVEEHHPTGRQREPSLTGALCQNHHTIEHRKLEDADIPLESEPNPLEERYMVHRCMSQFLERLAKAERNRAETTKAIIEKLDESVPGWREAIREQDQGDDN